MFSQTFSEFYFLSIGDWHLNHAVENAMEEDTHFITHTVNYRSALFIMSGEMSSIMDTLNHAMIQAQIVLSHWSVMTDWRDVKIRGEHILFILSSQVVNRTVEWNSTELSETPGWIPLSEALEVTLQWFEFLLISQILLDWCLPKSWFKPLKTIATLSR